MSPTAPSTSTHVRARIAQQAQHLLDQQHDPAVRTRMLDDLRARRAWRGDAPVDVRTEDADHEELVLHGQVLLESTHLDQPAVRTVLDTHGLVPALTCQTLGDDLTVLVATTYDADLTTAVDQLRAAGARASLHHLVPLGPIMKGVGPVPADAPR